MLDIIEEVISLLCQGGRRSMVLVGMQQLVSVGRSNRGDMGQCQSDEDQELPGVRKLSDGKRYVNWHQ